MAANAGIPPANREVVVQAVQKWLKWDRNEQTRHQVEQLYRDGDFVTLEKIMCKHIAFGTAGIRGPMGPGNARMNDLTIILISQGLASHVLKQLGCNIAQERGVVIGYDGRHNSFRFARLTASVFASAGFRVYLFSRVTPTPFVPYGVRLLKCVVGVMVTASHNPKEDNGYKVYWENGAQILPSHEDGVSASIWTGSQPADSSWNVESSWEDPLEMVEASYYDTLRPLCLFKEANSSTSLRFTYTAMHGVGGAYTMKALSLFGFLPEQHIVPVTEQLEPHPDFPTVEFPNPEEGERALRLAMATADKSGSRIILANDPDADRIGVAERRLDGVWQMLDGNQIGALLAWWAIHCRKHTCSLERSDYFVSTAVSSGILATMAKEEGLSHCETLSGFKWIGCLVDEKLKKEGSGQLLLAFEEALGFMYGSRVLDKDGVTAAAVIAEMSAYLEREEGGKTLAAKLNEIYERYGYHLSNNSYFVARDPSKIEKMFSTLQTLEDGHFPTVVAGAKVVAVRDLIRGVDTRMPDTKPTLPLSKVSKMITFWFDNNVTLTLRSSGTEPKLKWYSELVAKSQAEQPALDAFVADALPILARPDAFGFEQRSK